MLVSSSDAIRSPMQPLKVFICGYYGELNLGDDLLLETLLRCIPVNSITLITLNYTDCIKEIRKNIIVVNRRSILNVFTSVVKSDVIIFGGGSLFQDKTSMRSLLYYLLIVLIGSFRNIPIILWAQGLGPFKSIVGSWLVHYSLKSVDTITCRDQGSYQLAKSWDLKAKIEYAPDPIWQVKISNWVGGGPIVICWCKYASLDHYGWVNLLEALENFIKHTSLPVLWLSFHRAQDKSLFLDLDNKHMISDFVRSKSIFAEASNLEVVDYYFKKASIVIPMRLHAFILARLSGCPTIPLSYDYKVAAAACQSNMPYIDLFSPPTSTTILNYWIDALSSQCDSSIITSLIERSYLHNKTLSTFFKSRYADV